MNSALYFPWVTVPDPLKQYRPRAFAPCGFVAGVYARTDARRGVWKEPAGSKARLIGVTGVTTELNDEENGALNSKAINCIRAFGTRGPVIWGARTLAGNDRCASEWRYIRVRRTALFIEESLHRGLEWVAFDPNGEPLWAEIRQNVAAFMHSLFRQGAFQGTSSRDAYFVQCGKNTTTRTDLQRGIINIQVGFAPVKPAEFVIIQVQKNARPPT